MKHWLDALAFSHYGGWQADTQFVLQMGQGYLNGVDKPGHPVEDACTSLSVPESGRYRVWARTKNWLRDAAPGRFTVVVGGQPSPRVLGGAPSENWVWETAGDFDLVAGEVEIRLHDVTGYFPRCAALLITDDMNFTPPQPPEAVRTLRQACLGLPQGIQEGGHFDLIVVGGGSGGVPAAVAAARNGVRTLLITSRPVLGGNGSTEAGVHFDGASSRQAHARESGIAEELRRLRDRYGYGWTGAMETRVSREPHLTVMYDTLLRDAETKDRRITSITAEDTLTLVRTRYVASMYVDATGDGWLGYFAGASYRLGREAHWQHGESLAPEHADQVTMSGCLMGRNVDVGFLAEKRDHPVAYTAPEWRYVFPPGRKWNRFVTGVQGHWWLEHPGDVDDLYEAEHARDELIRISVSFFHWLKHDWDEKERAANYEMVRMPIYDAKRENRRIIGDYILTENDCVEGRRFPDVVAHTGWTLDVHHPKGVFSGREGPFHANRHIPMVHLPYRCLYARDVDNLFMAGRNISVTHVALGTVRVQNTIAAAAQAVGTAAAIALAHGTDPRGVYDNHLQELQQTLLRQDQFIPGIPRVDQSDLAPLAVITASSVKKDESYPDAQGIPAAWRSLSKTVAAMLPQEEGQVSMVWLYLKNEGTKPEAVTAHFRQERDPGLFWETKDMGEDTQTIPAGYEGWIAFHVGKTVTERYIWLYVEPTDGVFWQTLETPPLDWFRARLDNSGVFRVEAPGGMRIRLHPPIDETADCSPGQVVNGWGRIQSPNEYMWVSDGLPAALTLQWDQPVTLSSAVLTFDTDMNNPPMTRHMYPVPRTVVTHFTLSCLSGGKWVQVAAVSDNFQRRVVVTFPPVLASQMRIDVTGTGGVQEARILAVSCYA